MTHAEALDLLAKRIDEALMTLYGQRMGFALFMFPFSGEGEAGDYVSNATRPNMVKFMREVADRIEVGETIGRVIGEA